MFMKRTALFIVAILTISCLRAQTFPEKTAWSHFVWGAEVGGAIDMTSNDMSTVNLEAFFGYRGGPLQVLGIGASVNMMVSNSVRSFPVYMMVRTNFRHKPSLLFMDLRGGVVFNNVSNGSQQTGIYLSPGVGVNLARGKTFTSYLTLSYEYNGMDPYHKGDEFIDIHGLHLACIRLGIAF